MRPNTYSTAEFEAKYTYRGSDLGALWTREKTAFRLWAPTAGDVKINLYESGFAQRQDRICQLDMTPDVNGTWVAEKTGDLNGVYYTYQVTVNGRTREACDPYARAAGVNGKRAMILDLASTDPAGWETDTDPHDGAPITDAVIYELHIRDLSIDGSSGIVSKGKYLGLIESGTKTPGGIPTGLDHMKDLGITHVHLLPVYDYGSVDESRPNVPQYNWGYDPVNFNVPEGSYATDAANGAVRVAELKRMVKGLHDNGISVIMDVVYNHVYDAGMFCFNRIVPKYFSRATARGVYSNGSGCGNDTASERSMVRKYIVDSVKYWAEEYHIDGFRFDLVGLIDTVTVNTIMEEVHKTHPNVLFYGEGWSMATMVTKPGCRMTTQEHAAEVPGFSFFNDTIRDALKGSVFDSTAPGFVSGAPCWEFPLEQLMKGNPDWAVSPTQSVNYVSCHDNNTLMDRITLSTPETSRADRAKMSRLAAAFCLMAQGVPFFQAGEEMLRSKPLPGGGFDGNSYASSDRVNSIKWDRLEEEETWDTFRYYKGLIALRKAHPALRMTTRAEAEGGITAAFTGNPHTAAFHVRGKGADELFLIFNADRKAVEVPLPEGSWNICVSGNHAGTESLGTARKKAAAAPISALILTRDRGSAV